MKKFFTLVLFVVAFGFFSKAQELVVPYTNTEIVFDGYIDDGVEPWGATWIDIANTKDPAQANDADYTSAFQIFHTTDAIVIAVKVSDDTPDNSSANTYEKDCVEFFFHMDPTYTEAAYTDGSWQIRAQRIEDTENELLSLGYFDGTNVADILALDPGWAAGTSWGTEDSGTEYFWEVSFPKALLDQGANFDGENLLFDIAVGNGVDGVRTGQHFWKDNSDNQWQDVQTFTAISLAEGVGVEKLTVVEGSAFVKNNVLKVQNVNGLVNIYSLAGSLVASANIDGQGSIDISELNSGMYIVKGENLSVKVLK